jgi:chitinase
MSTYLAAAPALVRDRDVQPITEQLAEFLYDPLHDPGSYFYAEGSPGNYFEPWVARQDESGCGGIGIGSNYFLLEPTDTNPKNNFPASPPYVVAAEGRTYHLQNVALLPWYLGAKAPAGAALSFPDREALTSSALPCGPRPARIRPAPAATPAPAGGGASRHRLIGYWTGSDGSLPLGAVAPQWDVILVAFAPPKKGAPEGTLFFEPPAGTTPAELREAIAGERARGRTVMLSLGGGGEFFHLDRAADIPHFVESVSEIVTTYGFEGVDIDFESPSLVLAPGDTDFRRPTTPSIVNLIEGLRELRNRFGPAFRISLVPEGPQIPAARVTYGGQFGSYLPLVYGLRDILTFVDVQDYNTPPLEGLDGEIYQSSSVDYHAAMTELLLEGFDVGGDPAHPFPPVPAEKVAVGFLTGYTKPQVVSDAMRYLITGRAPAGTRYRLRRPSGHPSLIGAMFWTIDEDRRDNYSYSNLVGPELHGIE